MTIFLKSLQKESYQMSLLDLSFIQGNLPIPIKLVGDKEEPWKGPNKLSLCVPEPAKVTASPD